MFQVYIIPEIICKRLGRKPHYYWNIPESTISLLEDGALQLYEKRLTQGPGATEGHEGLGDFVEPDVCDFVEIPIKDIGAGDWLVVKFLESNFVAKVKEKSETKIAMKFMRKRTQTTLNQETKMVKFHFPANDDIVDYSIPPGVPTFPKEFLAKILPCAIDTPRRGGSINVLREIVEHFEL